MYYMACVGIKFLCCALKKTWGFFQYDIHLFLCISATCVFKQSTGNDTDKRCRVVKHIHEHLPIAFVGEAWM